MKNPYISQTSFIKGDVIKALPFGLATTADMMIEFMAKSDNDQLKDVAEFMKLSTKLPEMEMVFNFAVSMLKNDVTPIRGTIYDTGIDGIKELNEYMTDKYGKDEKTKINAKFANFINWILLRFPAKSELAIYGLIF